MQFFNGELNDECWDAPSPAAPRNWRRDAVTEALDCAMPDELIVDVRLGSGRSVSFTTYNMADHDRAWEVEASIDADGVVTLRNMLCLGDIRD